jgi:hypothetical protein
MLSTDHGVRHGLPFFWPAREEAVSLPWAVFFDIERDQAASTFVGSLLLWENVYALARECVVVGVIGSALLIRRLVFAARTRRASGGGPAGRETDAALEP